MGEELKKNLLQHQNISEVEEEEEEPLNKRVWKESKKMWRVAGPAIFNRFSTFGIQVVAQSFIGHIGSTELAAYALVMTVLVRFANGILVSQLFHNLLTRSRNFDITKIHDQILLMRPQLQLSIHQKP
jgi:MATE family multidrug resistance protein